MSTTRSDVIVSSPLDYIYDNLYRLIQATNPLPTMPDQTFTYDVVGNRLTEQGQVTPSTFDDANRLSEDQEFTYIYDNNGNMISKTSKATSEITDYTYDSENRLIEVDKPGMIATYKYNGLERRIEKDVNGTITRYVYDEIDILMEFDGANIMTARYTHGAGIDRPFIMERSGLTYFYQTDGLGSITELTDSMGNVSQSYVYDSFGNIVAQTGSLENPFTYTAREFDPESGLYYYRARHYDPNIGRFLQEDPIGFVGGINLYVYVGNNPINYIDPEGVFNLPGAIAGGLVGGVFGAVGGALGATQSGGDRSTVFTGIFGGLVGGFVGGGVAGGLAGPAGSGAITGAFAGAFAATAAGAGAGGIIGSALGGAISGAVTGGLGGVTGSAASALLGGALGTGFGLLGGEILPNNANETVCFGSFCMCNGGPCNLEPEPLPETPPDPC